MSEIQGWLTSLGALVAIIISVYNAFMTSRNLKKQQDQADQKMQTERKAADVSNTEKLQDMYAQAFGDFERLWKERLAEQEEKHKMDMERLALRKDKEAKDVEQKITGLYKQKEEILQFRITDLKAQIERLHGVVEGATGRNLQAIMEHQSDHITDPTE